MKIEDIIHKQSTSMEQVALSPEQLKSIYQYHPVFILADESLSEATVIGCKTLADLTFWTAKFNVFSNSHSNPEDRILFRGMVVDTEDIPNEAMGMTRCLVFVQEWSVELFTSVKEAAKGIEKLFTTIPGLEIEDIIVVIGRELSEKIKSKLNEKSDKIRKLIDEEKFSKPIILPISFDINPLARGNIG